MKDNSWVLGDCTVTQDPKTLACKVWLDGVFCPRLSLSDAFTLANRINNLCTLRGRNAARIRLAAYCVTVGVNE